MSAGPEGAATNPWRSGDAEVAPAGVHLAAMTRHMLGLFHGQPGARAWRRILTVEGVKPGAGVEVIEHALAAVRPRERLAEAVA